MSNRKHTLSFRFKNAVRGFFVIMLSLIAFLAVLYMLTIIVKIVMG